MKTYLILLFLICAFWAQAQVIPVGFIKQIGAAIPTISTSSVSNIGPYSASIGGSISSIGGSSIVASGVCYSSSNQTPTLVDNVTTDGASSGTFTSSLTSLTQGTTYYTRAYATNSQGTAYGNQISFTSYGTVTSPYTAKVWMDRNLGATQVATSSTDAASFGDLYQWGRANDGGALRTAPIVTTQLTDISIRSTNSINFLPWTSQLDWNTPSGTTTNSYTGASMNNYNVKPWNYSDGGANNPCPYGFRVPSSAEWMSEVNVMISTGLLTATASAVNNLSGAFNSFLKIPTAGVNESTTTTVDLSKVYFWTSERFDNSSGSHIRFFSNRTFINANHYRMRYSVRCIAK